ncbi:NADH-quinone oxidoreductase subunit H [compost metagenome]
MLCAAALGVFTAVPLPAWGGAVFAMLAQFGIFMAKVMFIAFVFIWVRWTLPRFRYDQVMDLGWKKLLPLALANILITGIGLVLVQRL